MNRVPAQPRPGRVRLLLAVVACILTAAPALAAPGARSTDGVWRELTPDVVQSGVLEYDFATTDDYRLLQLDDLALFRILRDAPAEFTPESRTSNAILALPMADGSFARFRVSRSPVLSPKLSAEYPEIMSYVAQGVDNPTHTARFARSPLGFNALIVTPTDYIVIELVEGGDGDTYVNFRRSGLPAPDGFTCSSDEETQAVLGKSVLAPPSGANLRTYDLALVATAEFRNAHASQAAVVQRFNNYITAVNAIYEVEVAIRFTITCTSTGYTNAGTDPFTNPQNVDGTLLDEADATLDADCGAYEVGHLLHLRAGGGNSFAGRAAFNSACQGNSGRAASTVTSVTSALWTTDCLPHEMGHQFGAQHTYNSTAGGCVERVAGSAYEIGNGTTLMSYACAGCTAAEDPNAGCADGYFHTHSFEQITDYREAGGNCGAQTATGNTAPSVGAGNDRTIPRGTPFALTATGSDPDGDAVTWCWEQHDLGAASPPLGGNGPLFRSLPATASATRTFPNLTSLLAGTATPFEILPTTDRTLTFRSTARDNRGGGGGVNYDTIVLTVAGDPFFVTAPNGGEALTAGCSTDVTWTVGGGSVAANVNISVSIDGGLTWPYLVAGNVPNDGTQSVVLPCVAATETDARVKVEAVDNVFFDVSNANFSITLDPTPPEITVTLNREYLWPPNHKLVDIVADVTVTDNCPNSSFVLTSITSNEPENDLGDGNTAPDIVGATIGKDDTEFQLRSERMGPGTGRVYTIVYTASDNCGNSTAAEVEVRVEHDQSGHAVVVAVSGAGSGFGDDYLAVVVPSALPSVADDGEMAAPVDRSATVPRRAPAPQDLLIGNTADVLEASRVVFSDVDGDGLRDAVALFSLGKVEAIRAQSTELDGPVGLHYANDLGESFLVADLLAIPQSDLATTLGATVLTALDGAESGASMTTGATGMTAASPPSSIVEAAMPAITRLAGFRPNPFVARTAVSFELARSSRVTVDVFGPDGRRVRGLADLAYDPGRHTVSWDGRDDAGQRVAAGVYFVRFAADGVVETGKALLLP